MEPVTAFGLAAGILQFVQFSSDIFKAAYGSYQILQRNDVDGICERLKELSNELDDSLQSAAGPTGHSGQRPLLPREQESKEELLLRDLARSCRQDCESLVMRLGMLRSRSGPRQFWASFKDALNGSLSSGKDSLRHIQDRIKQHESTLTVHMCAVMVKNGKQLQQQINKLILANKASASSIDSRLVSLGVNLTDTLGIIRRMAESHHNGADASREMDVLAARLKELSLDTMHVKNSGKIKDILASLDYPQRSARHEAIPEAHAETFQWALSSSKTRTLEDDKAQSTIDMDPNRGKLLEWLESGTGTFWVSGKPGSGKSTFMKYVADHPATARSLEKWASSTGHKVVVMSHYFWSAGSQIQKSQNGLWRSLLLELLRQAPDLTPAVCKELWNKLDDVSERNHSWSTRQLRDSLECFAKLSPTEYKFCIFIDGLDEFDGDHSDMVETLLRLSESSHLKLCIASRPWNVFETGFGGEYRQKIYIQDLTHQDIVKFTRSRLQWRSRSSWAHSVTMEECERLITGVTDRAQGVFLWVFLVTKYLREGLDNDDTFSNLQAMLQAFPPELEPFFNQMLDSVTQFYHCRMAGLLRLSLVAEKPLSFMVYHFHDREHDDVSFVAKTPVCHLHEDTAADLRRRMVMRLNGLCKGLLEIDKHDEVQFIHRTVRDWLMSGPMETYLKHKTQADWDGTISLLQGHLGWYKCPTSQDLVSAPLLSALGYRELISQYYEANGTGTVNRILDGFLSITTELDGLGFSLPGLNNNGSPEPGNTGSLVVFKARLLESGLWDYLLLKLDEEPGFLDVLARSPLPIYIALDSQPREPWSDREASVRSKVAASFQVSLLRQNTDGSTTDPLRSILALPCNQAEVIVTMLQSLLHMGAEPTPFHDLGDDLDPYDLLGLLIRVFLTEDNGADLSKWESYFIQELAPGSRAWSLLCKKVTSLRDRPETDSLTQAAGLLRFIISEYSPAKSPSRISTSWSPSWSSLAAAVELGFPDRCVEIRAPSSNMRPSFAIMCDDQDEPWPPIPPDISSDDMLAKEMLENPCQPFLVHQHQLYKSKDGNSVYRMSAEQREYDLHQAAGDCAIALCGRVLAKNQWAGSIDLDGYFMEFATPVEHASTTPTQRKQIVQEMIHVVEKIHKKHIIHGDMKLDNMLLDRHGHLRLCDFEEGLFEDEDEETWNGNVTWHYVSPNRRHREEQLGHDAPPRKEDDIYGLGLSIWALTTGKIPFEEIAQDDLGLREVLLRGDTVDVTLIDDDEIQEIVKGFLRQGGAHI